MLRISEQWHGTDLGRQRQGNEDNYFVRAPLFVVADGMGGAQAGEVASEMAVDSFESGLPDGSPPADGLVRIVEDANRAIHERSRTDAQRGRHGHDGTAAYVGEREVTIAHVGDSRAYVLRGGELIRLTKRPLARRRARRPRQAHRGAGRDASAAVGDHAGARPGARREVDVHVYQAAAGDLFMLCSDGLTSMVPEARVKPIIEARGLARARPGAS